MLLLLLPLLQLPLPLPQLLILPPPPELRSDGCARMQQQIRYISLPVARFHRLDQDRLELRLLLNHRPEIRLGQHE